jgi:hypothetical protein
MQQIIPYEKLHEEEYMQELQKIDANLIKLQNFIVLQYKMRTKGTKSIRKEDGSQQQIYKTGGEKVMDSFFHALGMILYNKRIDPLRPTSTPHKMTKQQYQSNPRPIKYFDVEKVVDSINISFQKFNNFLHENYLAHFTNIKEAYKMADCFSIADYNSSYQIRNNLSLGLDTVRREECILNARGCMSYNLSQYEIGNGPQRSKYINF